MSMDVRVRSLMMPFVFSIIGVVILVGLGNWQMQRKAWKAELIQTVNERLAASPMALADLLAKEVAGDDVRYQPVTLTGTFDHSRERFYFLPYGAQVGWHILTPFEVVSGEVLFVDRGFVPDKLLPQKDRLDGLPRGELTIEGLVRPFAEQAMFVPDNDTANNKWYWREKASLYASLKDEKIVQHGFLVDVRASAQFGKWPKAGVTRVKFLDKHLGYALTWYGLALTLIGVFGSFAYTRWKQ